MVALQFAWQAPLHWRAFIFPWFFIGSLGWLQAHAKTCVSNAARGVRDADADALPAGLDAVAIDVAIARQARSIRIQALLLEALLTALLFALPRS